MNANDQRMLDLLRRGRDEFVFVAIKAEFEAEGTRPDEFLRLLEITRRADLKVALKIGGCEAVSDLQLSLLYGVDYIIAPMVETVYSLTKFIEAKNKVYGKSGRDSTEFLYNLETQTTLENLSKMADVAASNVDGIVFGRVDFTLSRGMPRGAVNEESITDAVLAVSKVCADKDLDLVVGGSVSVDSIPALRSMAAIRLDRFETRKVVFQGSAANASNIEAGINSAVAFELAWLKGKRDYYQAIASEDAARIEMMEARLRT